MRAYYVIDYDGLHTSPTIYIPEGLNKEQAATYVYGEMMLESWTLDTPHAIYIDDGNGYEVFCGDDDVNEKVHAGSLLDDDEEEVEVDAGELAGETSGGYPCYLPDDFLDGSSSSC